jgi:hypothetical protein
MSFTIEATFGPLEPITCYLCPIGSSTTTISNANYDWVTSLEPKCFLAKESVLSWVIIVTHKHLGAFHSLTIKEWVQ